MAESTAEKVAAGISALGSGAWIGAAFGYGLMDLFGPTAGTMAATMLGVIGVYTIGSKLDGMVR